MLPHDPVEIEVELPGGPVRLVRPRSADALVDAIEALDADERLPYWADLWPAALGLAAAVADGSVPVAGRAVLELGAGLGLVSLAVSRARAASCVATDWDADALAYVAESARRNGLAIDTEPLDWREPPERRADVVLAADVLYEARNAEPVARALAALVAPGGEAWIADPGRRFAADFLRAAGGWTVTTTARRVAGPHLPRGAAAGVEVTLYRLRRRPQ